MKEYTEDDWKYKAEAYCSAAERCRNDVEVKLRSWGASSEAAERILSHLEKERYVDEGRFCRAFVRDKYRFNRWGRMKIVQALRAKHLPSELIRAGLDEIDEEEYRSGLAELLRQKARTLRTENDYGREVKLVRFAVGRGFTVEEALECVRLVVSDEDLA